MADIQEGADIQKGTDIQEGLSIIDKDSSVEGSFNVKGKLIVEGSLKGDLIGNKVVTVEGSLVDAPARVREMIIGGEFQGDITVYENLRILSTGSFTGRITCNSLTLDTGGKLNGRVKPLNAQQGFSTMTTPFAAGGDKPASPKDKGDKEDKGPVVAIDLCKPQEGME